MCCRVFVRCSQRSISRSSMEPPQKKSLHEEHSFVPILDEGKRIHSSTPGGHAVIHQLRQQVPAKYLAVSGLIFPDLAYDSLRKMHGLPELVKDLVAEGHRQQQDIRQPVPF